MISTFLHLHVSLTKHEQNNIITILFRYKAISLRYYIVNLIYVRMVKQSLYRLGQALRAPGG